MRERAPDVVSVAAKVKELQADEYFVCISFFIYLTHVTWPKSSLSESLSSAEAFIFSLTEYHCLMRGMQWKVKKKIAHRMLMMSFPWPISAARAWSPFRRASLLVFNISTDVSWKMSTISRSRRTPFKGTKSTMALRKRGVPIFTKAKDMTLWENRTFKPKDLKFKLIICSVL